MTHDVDEDHPTPSPFTQLPPELLIKCLEHAANHPFDSRSASPSPTPSYPLTPPILAQVCHTWRTIVLSTPSLWTHLVLSSPKHEEETYRTRLVYDSHLVQRDIHALETYYTRSKNLPLQLVILQDYGTEGDGGSKPRGYVDAVKGRLVPAIVKFITRCKVLVVRAFVHRRSLLFNDSTAESKSVLGAIRASRTLKELTFVALMHTGPRLRFELPGTLEFLSITSLVLYFGPTTSSTYSRERCNATTDTPLQIRRLEVTQGDSWLEFARIAHRFTHLEDLDLDVCQDFLIDASNDVLIVSRSTSTFDLSLRTIPNLRILNLTLSTNLVLRHMNDVSSAWTLLDFLDLPSLVELHIDFGLSATPPRAATSRIQAFFRRSPKLRKLSLFGTLCSSVLVSFLRETPCVEQLIVVDALEDGEGGFEGLLGALAEVETGRGGGTKPRVCSRLRYVCFPDVETVSVRSMAKFCLARMRAQLHQTDLGLPLSVPRGTRHPRRVFEANFFIDQPEEDYAADPDIQWCIDKGMRLSVNADTLTSSLILGEY